MFLILELSSNFKLSGMFWLKMFCQQKLEFKSKPEIFSGKSSNFFKLEFSFNCNFRSVSAWKQNKKQLDQNKPKISLEISFLIFEHKELHFLPNFHINVL